MTSSPDARRFCIRVRAAGWPLAEVRPAPTAATPHSRRGRLAAPDAVMGFRRWWTARMLRTSNHAPGNHPQRIVGFFVLWIESNQPQVPLVGFVQLLLVEQQRGDGGDRKSVV